MKNIFQFKFLKKTKRIINNEIQKYIPPLLSSEPALLMIHTVDAVLQEHSMANNNNTNMLKLFHVR
jgi:hypothetical protein